MSVFLRVCPFKQAIFIDWLFATLKPIDTADRKLFFHITTLPGTSQSIIRFSRLSYYGEV